MQCFGTSHLPFSSRRPEVFRYLFLFKLMALHVENDKRFDKAIYISFRRCEPANRPIGAVEVFGQLLQPSMIVHSLRQATYNSLY
jgi:hypothetical protein